MLHAVRKAGPKCTHRTTICMDIARLLTVKFLTHARTEISLVDTLLRKTEGLWASKGQGKMERRATRTPLMCTWVLSGLKLFLEGNMAHMPMWGVCVCASCYVSFPGHVRN